MLDKVLSDMFQPLLSRTMIFPFQLMLELGRNIASSFQPLQWLLRFFIQALRGDIQLVASRIVIKRQGGLIPIARWKS